MLRRRFLVTTVMAVTAAMSSTAVARDRLESIVSKPKLNRQDRAIIKTEIAARVRKLVDAGKDAKRRRAARDKLVGTSQLANSTRAGQDAYAEACAETLSPLVVGNELNVALDATLVLVAVGHVNTADALATALQSAHAAVRYKAARGLQQLHKELAARGQACRTVLRALGRAGASEKTEPVLRVIYEAIHFGTDVPSFRYNDECAAALNTVYAGRLARLAAGSRDELKDAPSYAPAADCYDKANPNQQKELVQHMAAFLGHYVDRYCDDSTAEEYFPTIAGLIDEVEKVLRQMMRKSGMSPPSDRISAHVKPTKPNDRRKRQVRAALAAVKAVLAKAP